MLRRGAPMRYCGGMWFCAVVMLYALTWERPMRWRAPLAILLTLGGSIALFP
jgi:hypothetical protein